MRTVILGEKNHGTRRGRERGKNGKEKGTSWFLQGTISAGRGLRGRERERMSEEWSNTTTAASSEERTLELTPTWAVATVCFLLILVSVFLEHLIQLLAQYLRSKRKRSLIQALDKIKSELMLLGFLSLLLTMTERPIANICIPKSVAETFLPCSSWESSEEEEETKCLEQDKVSLLSRKGMQQLQYLIFVLAFFHSLSCMLTFALGMAKMRKWESWEAETRTLEYQFSNDPRRFKLVHQTSFARRHLTCWSDHRLLRWPAFMEAWDPIQRS